MQELVTEAIILESRSGRGKNRQVDLFTKKIGRVRARATSGMKTVSKLSPHLNPLNLSTIRLVNKNIYLITDALTKNSFKKIRKNENHLGKALKTIDLVSKITPLNLQDGNLWFYLENSFKNLEFDNSKLLTILGYNPKLATCINCNNNKVSCFIPSDQSFVCKQCGNKIKKEEIFKI